MKPEDHFQEGFRITAPTFVVTGPTAGGKGRLARRVAERLGEGVLSLDSMKVYRGMDIGSAKPEAALRASLPFHLMDLRDPWQAFSVGDYLDELRALAPRLGRCWVFSGGTGFYLNTLREGIFRGPPPDPDYRRQLEEEAGRVGLEELHHRLAELDPESGERIHPTDRRRVIRALEVMRSCSDRFSDLQARRVPILDPTRTRLIGIGRVRSELYRRIDERVVRMYDAGWIEEVERLIRAHDPPWSPQADQSIGYHQIRAALIAGEDPCDRVTLIQQRTRHFARHQRIWFRKMPIEWWRPEDEDELLDSIEASVDHFERVGVFPSPSPDRLRNDEL